MKWIFGLLTLSVLFYACDNELVVTDEWKDIPVVWGLLNQSDTAHYIRVEKAFLDPTTSALDIARISDSLYYENASVSLKHITSGEIFVLERVNGDLEGYPREGGIFAETPNYLFKIDDDVIDLVVGDTYEFILDRGDGTPLVTAQTIILSKPILRDPSPGSLLPFKRGTQYLFNWKPILEAGIFDLKLRFHYHEKTPETGNVFIQRSVEWTLARNLIDPEYRMQGVDFYNAVLFNVGVDLDATRRFDSIDVIVWAGGKELAEFIRITQANTGITSTQDIPIYTNLSEGVGIFSSRSVSYNTGFNLTLQSLDSLKNSNITEPLNFQ